MILFIIIGNFWRKVGVADSSRNSFYDLIIQNRPIVFEIDKKKSAVLTEHARLLAGASNHFNARFVLLHYFQPYITKS
jgi:hypothetical protein